ncbi:uncharacterized protein BDZ99DRAFT_130125 [Mytilinidion resinicola]|uniref:Uncharacterized protein n=1 Tax=Mytilinidion resinicola TaxID=574789 RepID=A0A6A6Z572_9PEZI|nr:uncharacterized protein BDZ99DRAFT_130125 [Mytilinidion resinicola]KAF2816170.1 hypothetical protein BDZ99DRAFT_130125 [Mytilinidion resinicola]
MEFGFILSQVRCESDCLYCDQVGQQRGSRKCITLQVCGIAIIRARKQKWNLNKSLRFGYAAFQLYFETFRTLNGNREYMALLLRFESLMQGYQRIDYEHAHISTLAEQDLLTSLGPNHYLTRTAILDVALQCVGLGKYAEAESKLKIVLKESFDDVFLLCSGTTFPQDIGTAVRLVTQGHVQVEFGEDDMLCCSYRCMNGTRVGEDWCHYETGELNVREIELRGTATWLLSRLRYDKGQIRTIGSV